VQRAENRLPLFVLLAALIWQRASVMEHKHQASDPVTLERRMATDGSVRRASDDVTVERLEQAIVAVARVIAESEETLHVPLLERLEAELKKMKDARDGVSRARRIVEASRERKGDLLKRV
jgi:hypothetical protein